MAMCDRHTVMLTGDRPGHSAKSSWLGGLKLYPSRTPEDLVRGTSHESQKTQKAASFECPIHQELVHDNPGD